MYKNLSNFFRCLHTLFIYSNFASGEVEQVLFYLSSIYFNIYNYNLGICEIAIYLEGGTGLLKVRRLNSNAANKDKQTVILQGQKYS